MKKEHLSILKRLWSIPAHANVTRMLMRVQPEARSSRGTILVIRLDQIGDVILTYPFLEALKTLRPGDRLVLVTNPSLVDFAEATSPADDVLAFDPGESLFKRSGIRRQAAAMRFAARLRRRLGKIDLALVPRRGLDYLHATQLAALCRPGQLVGFGAAHEEPTQVFQGSRSLLDLKVDITPGIQESLQPFELLKALGHEIEPRFPRLELPENTFEVAETHWARVAGDRMRVVLIAGAGHPRRCWPAERFAGVLEEAGAQVPLTCIALGTAKESAIIPKSTKTIDIHDLCGDCSLLESAALIARSDVVLTNDTGPMHIAAALGRPLVAISCHPLGADPDHVNAPERFRPASHTASLARPQTPTPGCEAGCDAEEECCILRVEEADVLEHFMHALGDQARTKTTRRSREELEKL